MQLRASPVKEVALAAGLPVLQPANARSEELVGALSELRADVAVVVAYGKILPAALLGVTPKGFVNVHFSLLPKYRGAAPVQRTLMEGATQTGVTIMVLTEGMDEGPILASEPTPIEASETSGELGARLADVGADLLARTLPSYLSGELVPEPQDHQRATYAPKVTGEEARIDWGTSARAVADHVRGLNPDPVAWTTFRGKRVRILRTEPGPQGTLEPGELDAGEGLVAGTGHGVVRLVELQMPGKRPMEGEQVARGLRLERGERLI